MLSEAKHLGLGRVKEILHYAALRSDSSLSEAKE
jgi:hypothetical protein